MVRQSQAIYLEPQKLATRTNWVSEDDAANVLAKVGEAVKLGKLDTLINK